MHAGQYLPPVDASEEELLALRQFRPKLETLSAGSATASQLLTGLKRVGILHFSGHGIAGMGTGALILAPDRRNPEGLLSADDLAAHRFPALELVTLASCESGTGETRRTVDPESLVRAMLRSGAGRVVASTWKVPSGATGALFARFYAELASTSDVVLSLQRSRAWIQSRAQWRHPYYWAGFLVYGPPFRTARRFATLTERTP